MLRKLTREDVIVTITAEDESLPPEGQFASGDADADAETCRQIRADAESNPWAWCTVRVRATFQDLRADQYLGCCSYADEEAFRADAYFDDMVNAAIAELNDHIANIVDALRVRTEEPS